MKHNQFVRHALAAADAYVGPIGEITVVTDTNELRSHDGVTPGGHQIPTIAQISGFDVLVFNAVSSHGAPGELPASIQNQLAKITLAGTYDLPELADVVNIGGPLTLKAMVPGVILECQGADQIESGVTNVTSINMVEGEIVKLAKMNASFYVLVNRYVP